MKKYLILILIVFINAGCTVENSYEEVSYPVMPPELKGCKVFELKTSGPDPNLYVIKCPNCPDTTTSYYNHNTKSYKHNSLITSEDI